MTPHQRKPAKEFMTPAKIAHHQDILSNRVRNRYKHFCKRFRKQNIECFRLYDWDIPEVRAVIDWYKGHLVIAEYVREQSSEAWLPAMAEAVAQTLEVPFEHVHIKERRTQMKGEERYEKLDSTNERMIVCERDIKVYVNLNDFLDTGLFSDHRNTRQLIEKMAKDQDFLNLYAYTGAFSLAAAKGGARHTATVDRSKTYIDWARDNFELNGLTDEKHVFAQTDVFDYLRKAKAMRKKFSLGLLDPPSFFKDKEKNLSFDINKDHVKLLKLTLGVMKKGGTLFFSTNHQRFEPRFKGMSVADIYEITPKTIPEDYFNRQIHRCWKITV